MFWNILKNSLAVIVSFIFIGAAYFFVLNGGDPSKLPWSVGQQVPEKDTQVMDRLAERLSGLQSIDIKTELFSRPEFKVLQPYRTNLPTLDGAVENPFQ